MVMFKLKRCVAPSREEFEKQRDKDIQKVPLILDELQAASKEKVAMLADDIVVCV